ncbi:MAG: DUF4124 domain-containing protein [Gammaproteobacteria bacterium]|nr:DUF4124 domain-containing protein [Gammaproteobacteria bacterium]
MLNTNRLLLVSFLYLGSSLTQLSFAELYKCKDNNNKTIYSDEACLKTTGQEIDIVDSSIDLSISIKSHEQEQEQNHNRYSPNRRDSVSKRKIVSVKTKKDSKKCKSYKSKIRSRKQQQKSGYTISEGKRIKNSMDRYSNLYNQNCK